MAQATTSVLLALGDRSVDDEVIDLESLIHEAVDDLMTRRYNTSGSFAAVSEDAASTQLKDCRMLVFAVILKMHGLDAAAYSRVTTITQELKSRGIEPKLSNVLQAIRARPNQN
jgi:hypothetical protein